MKRLTTDIVLKYGIPKKDLARLKANDSDDFNGFYNYGDGVATVNVGSLDFKGLSETDIIGLFSCVMVHETLHHVIHCFIGTKALVGLKGSRGEERVVELLAGQKSMGGA